MDGVDVGSRAVRKTSSMSVAAPAVSVLASATLTLWSLGPNTLARLLISSTIITPMSNRNPDIWMATNTAMSSPKALSPPIENSQSLTTAYQNFLRMSIRTYGFSPWDLSSLRANYQSEPMLTMDVDYVALSFYSQTP
ncbi:hypothetical protein HAX54_028530 [Datura stramonium]|uniref:Uncharacterized protein n=1 Tax=Datura stramonium TaxID=4076 RepID=A0ABS8V6K3_DATST|nr:hypothetical protein [Datura stramonium]